MLFGGTVATGAILTVLIPILGAMSGARSNLAVTLLFLMQGAIRRSETALDRPGGCAWRRAAPAKSAVARSGPSAL